MKTFLLFINSIFFTLSISAQVKLNDLKAQTKHTEDFLYSQQNNSGYFQDSSNGLFNVWETIICVKALSTRMKKNEFTTNGSLLQAYKWLKSNQNSTGLICHNDICTSAYCIETSSIFLDLCLKFEPEINQVETLEFLESLQKENGSWEVGNPDVQFNLDYPSVTAFVLNFYTNNSISLLGKEKALSFLNEKYENGLFWNSSWEYYGSPSYGIWQIVPALSADEKSCVKLDSIIKEIISKQKVDGSWSFQTNPSVNCISSELETAFILNALIRLNKKDLLPTIEKGIVYLQKQQNSKGAWNGGYFPIPNQRYKKAEYLVCTALVYELFTLYLKQIENE